MFGPYDSSLTVVESGHPRSKFSSSTLQQWLEHVDCGYEKIGLLGPHSLRRQGESV